MPEDFRFSVKVPRAITHDAQMRDIDELLARFAGEVGELKHKLGCLLVQTPPKLGFHDETARDFFIKLQDTFGCMIACEGRHPSWFSENATEVLRERRVTRVIADPAAGQPGPHVPTSQRHLRAPAWGAAHLLFVVFARVSRRAGARHRRAPRGRAPGLVHLR